MVLMLNAVVLKLGNARDWGEMIEPLAYFISSFRRELTLLERGIWTENEGNEIEGKSYVLLG